MHTQHIRESIRSLEVFIVKNVGRDRIAVRGDNVIEIKA